MANEQRPRVGGAVICMLVGPVLIGCVVLVIARLDWIIDSANFYVNIPVLGGVLGVIVIVGLALWLAGCRLYAYIKGYSSLFGLILGFLLIPGALVLFVVPRRPVPAEAESAPAEQ